MKKNRRVTIIDIAKALNVSIGTVDRALHGRPGINEETRRRVLEKAEELNYKVNNVARSLSRKKSVKIGAVIPNRVTSMKYFFDDVINGIERAAEELKDFKIEILIKSVDSIDHISEINAINKLLEDGIDGLAICPFHRYELNQIINEVTDKGIPVVTIGTDAPESKRLTCISTNSYKTGEMAGELMAKFINFEGKVVVMTGFKNITDNDEKVSGFCNILKTLAPKVKVERVYETLELEEKAYLYTRKAIEEIPDLAGIYVATANSPGVCRALEDAGKKGAIKIIATDIFADNSKYIKDGSIYATIYQAPFKQGYNSIYTLYQNITLKKSFPSVCYVKSEVVMNTNMSFYEQNSTLCSLD